MLFNSIDFAVFLPVVLFSTGSSPITISGYKILLIVAASYIFYGWWTGGFIAHFFSTGWLFHGLFSKEDSEPGAKIYLWVSILINIRIARVLQIL